MSAHQRCRLCGYPPQVDGSSSPASSGATICCERCQIEVHDRMSISGAWQRWDELMSRHAQSGSTANEDEWVQALEKRVEFLESLLSAERTSVSIGLESAARQAYAHWAEFGPSQALAESMDHLGEALNILDGTVVNRPGYDALWAYFGLSYASFVVLPRAFMHAMPGDWQGAMARLLRQWDDTWEWPDDMGTAYVTFRISNRYVRTPSWIINYRHPETKTIEALRRKP